VSAVETSAPRRRSQLKRVMTFADRAALGLVYVVVLSLMPLAAVGLWTRTV